VIFDLRRVLPALAAVVVAAAAISAVAPQYSELWGKDGERWTPGGRLPDFSYAGYHSGEAPIPAVSLQGAANVRDFGAKGDGEQDDTAAVLKALESGAKVVYLPAGRYRITGILEIRHGNVVLHGDGPDKTVLYCPKPLHDIRPDWSATTSGQKTSNYSWAGGFVWVKGGSRRRQIATVTAAAKRGTYRVEVSSTAGVQPGQRIEIAQRDNPDNSLAAHLYSDDPGNTSKLLGRAKVSLTTRVAAVEEKALRLERPLRADFRPEWRAVVYTVDPAVTEVGIENLGFEFPAPEYKGHFTEMGFNAIAISGGSHCWVRDIRIVNPDSGLFVSGTFNTVDRVVFETSRAGQKNGNGHHGIYLGGEDNLFSRFDYRMRFIHDISVAGCAGNVIKGGKGVDLDFDHHKAIPYENLFTDIDAGAGTRLWMCGGGADLGRHCAARGTFWNIRARSPLRYPPAEWGPASMNLVAFDTDQPSRTETAGRWFEAIAPAGIAPADLHAAQLARRLRKEGRK
jgi:hypothetical protein